MKSTIRAALVIASALPAIFVGGAPQAANQEYPNWPLRYIVAFPPGGASDIIARLVTPALSEGFGQQVIIDNRGGAAGTIGAEIAARATPDGYTLFAAYRVARGEPGALQEARLRSRALFRADRSDGEQPQRPRHSSLDSGGDGRGVHRLRKARPGKLNNGSAGMGTSPQLSMESLMMTLASTWSTSRTRAAGRCWWP